MGILDTPGLGPNSRSAERLAAARALALVPYYVAIANRNVDILCLGDSKTEGHGASVVAARWLDLVAAGLRATYNPPGVTGGYGYVPAWYASTYDSAPTVRWTYSGTVNSSSQETGLGRRMAELTTSGSQGTITATCSSFILFFGRKNTGADSVTVTIDGGAPATVSITGTSGGPTTSGFVWSSGALVPGTHTIVVARNGGSPFLEGVFFHNADETSGVRLWDGGHSGYLCNGYTDGSAHSTKWQAVVDDINPAMTIIAFGTNEHGTGARTPSQFGADVSNLIAAVRAQHSPSCFLLLLHNERVASGTTPVAAYAEYVAQAYAVAQADTGGVAGSSGVAVLDLTKRIPQGSSPDSIYGLTTDGVHYTDKGNRLVADALLGFLAAR